MTKLANWALSQAKTQSAVATVQSKLSFTVGLKGS